MTNKPAKQPHKYTVRKDGQTYAAWDDPAVTYPRTVLQSMKKAGYRLYVDGKLQR